VVFEFLKTGTQTESAPARIGGVRAADDAFFASVQEIGARGFQLWEAVVRVVQIQSCTSRIPIIIPASTPAEKTKRISFIAYASQSEF
jgi:hypothetical protein